MSIQVSLGGFVMVWACRNGGRYLRVESFDHLPEDVRGLLREESSLAELTALVLSKEGVVEVDGAPKRDKGQVHGRINLFGPIGRMNHLLHGLDPIDVFLGLRRDFGLRAAKLLILLLVYKEHAGLHTFNEVCWVIGISGREKA